MYCIIHTYMLENTAKLIALPTFRFPKSVHMLYVRNAQCTFQSINILIKNDLVHLH